MSCLLAQHLQGADIDGRSQKPIQLREQWLQVRHGKVGV
jgi:hypothetical protein